jgi:transcriptional regulator with XRE-family HTH domain
MLNPLATSCNQSSNSAPSLINVGKVMLQVGATIRKLRLAKQYSLNDLANGSGFTKSYLSKVENEKREPTLSSLNLICNKLGIPLNLFILIAEINPTENDEFQSLNNILRESVLSKFSSEF